MAAEHSYVSKIFIKNTVAVSYQNILLLNAKSMILSPFYTCIIFAAYKARLHTLPPPEALHTVMPFMSERMRKRKAFADKELETVMFEREQNEKEKISHLHMPPGGHHLHNGVLSPGSGVPASSSALNSLKGQLGHQSPKEFLMRIFPTMNPNLLELVWQGSGGNLEKAIEQIVSNCSVSNMHTTYMAQQMALQQHMIATQMAAMSKCVKTPQDTHSVPSSGITPHGIPSTPGHQSELLMPSEQTLSSNPRSAFTGPTIAQKPSITVPSRETNVIPPGPQGLPSTVPGHPAAFGFFTYNAAAANIQAALLARIQPAGHSSIPKGPIPAASMNHPNNDTSAIVKENLLREKSAFVSTISHIRHPSNNSSPSPASSLSCVSPAGSSSSSQSEGHSDVLNNSPIHSVQPPIIVHPAKHPKQVSSPIKFSVESIIGK